MAVTVTGNIIAMTETLDEAILLKGVKRAKITCQGGSASLRLGPKNDGIELALSNLLTNSANSIEFINCNGYPAHFILAYKSVDSVIVRIIVEEWDPHINPNYKTECAAMLLGGGDAVDVDK